MSAKSGKDKKISKQGTWLSWQAFFLYFGNVWELLAEDRIVMERHVEQTNRAVSRFDSFSRSHICWEMLWKPEAGLVFGKMLKEI